MSVSLFWVKLLWPLTFHPFPGALTEDRQRKVPEFVLLFAVFDENKSWYREVGRAYKPKKSSDRPKFHTINGFVNSTLKGMINFIQANNFLQYVDEYIFTVYCTFGKLNYYYLANNTDLSA